MESDAEVQMLRSKVATLESELSAESARCISTQKDLDTARQRVCIRFKWSDFVSKVELQDAECHRMLELSKSVKLQIQEELVSPSLSFHRNYPTTFLLVFRM